MENVPISKLILFVSTVPEARMCRTLMNILNSRGILQQLNGFLSMVRLDTEESRRKVMNGKYFSITQVPSLVVILQNNVTKIYSGNEKIARYLDLLVNPPQNENPYTDQNPYGGKYVSLDEQAEAFQNSKNKNKKIVIGDDLNLPIKDGGIIEGEIMDDEGGFNEPILEIEPEVEPEIEEEVERSDLEEIPKPKKSTKKSSKKTTKKSSAKTPKKMSLKTAEKVQDSELMLKAKAMQAQFSNNIELTTPKPKK